MVDVVARGLKSLLDDNQGGRIAMDSDKWGKIPCPRCGGFGVVSEYTLGGTDFLGPAECGNCEGNGVLWRHETGTIAVYPGGPLRGKISMRGEEA